MPENVADHLDVRDRRDDPQRSLLTPGTGRQIEVKDPFPQLGPGPARCSAAGFRRLDALLAWGREDCGAQLTVGRQTPP
jgi:hypothetical protein